MSILAGIGAGIQGATALGGTIAGAIQSHQNLKFQKEQFAYQKQLNNEYLDRMDNRLQYITKDSVRAGINPLAAIGQAGGYSGQTSAPAPQQDTGYLKHLEGFGNSFNNALVNAKIIADSKVALAQANQLNAQTTNTTTDTDLKKQMKENMQHDLDIANNLNAPIGILPDVEKDLYHDLRNYIKERIEKEKNKDKHKPNNKYKEGEHLLKSKYDKVIEESIDDFLGNSLLNKARHWLGEKINSFNKALYEAGKKHYN